VKVRGRGGMSLQAGQASVELVAVIPALLLVVVIAVQLALVGYGLWSAADASRAGARAAHVGGEAREAARSAIPQALERGAKVRRGPDERVRVTVRVPSLLPGAEAIPVRAATGLDPGAGGG